MRMKQINSLCVFFLLTIVSITAYPQDTTDVDTAQFKDFEIINSRKIIAEYSGGRFGFSGVYLTLYSDSTFIISGWLDNGFNYKYNGTFYRKGTLITLCRELDKKDLNRKNIKKHRMTERSTCQTYRMRKDMILMYTESEEKSKNAEFYKEYHTLYLEKH